MTDNRTDRRADAIERDVERTQDAMGDTVDKLEESLTPREIKRSVLGDDGAEVADEALEVTRQNPVPVALIAIGLIWLLASSRSPAIRRLKDRISSRRSSSERAGLRPRWAEPAPIGPPPPRGEEFDRRRSEPAGFQGSR